jgi:hypothetical protein
MSYDLHSLPALLTTSVPWQNLRCMTQRAGLTQITPPPVLQRYLADHRLLGAATADDIWMLGHCLRTWSLCSPSERLAVAVFLHLNTAYRLPPPLSLALQEFLGSAVRLLPVGASH